MIHKYTAAGVELLPLGQFLDLKTVLPAHEVGCPMCMFMMLVMDDDDDDDDYGFSFIHSP